MQNSIGEKICYYRQLKKMTQEEHAVHIDNREKSPEQIAEEILTKELF